MKILLATNNAGKLNEMKLVFGRAFGIVTLAELENVPDIHENERTFEDNALFKARSYFGWSGIPTVASDGGLEIDALDGEPGVYSRRWPFGDEETGKPGRRKTDRELIDIALKKLRGVPDGQRTARLRDAEAFYDGTRSFVETASIDGHITASWKGDIEPGYPFRSIFWVDRFDKLYRDLTDEEHSASSHRRVALQQLRERILERA